MGDRRHEVPFLNASKLVHMVNCSHLELDGGEIVRIADTCHTWLSEEGTGE